MENPWYDWLFEGYYRPRDADMILLEQIFKALSQFRLLVRV
jgi:hypothetical protein